MSETIPNKVTHIEELHDSDCPDEVTLMPFQKTRRRKSKKH